MAQGSKRKRSRILDQSTNIVTSSIDLSSDDTFLVNFIDGDDIFLTGLSSNLITYRSFTYLYQRSKLLNWNQVLSELIHSLKSDDDKSKFKQLALYRLIDEYLRDPGAFEERVKKLDELIGAQLSSFLTPTHPWFNRFLTMDDIYTEINRWRNLHWTRRLLHGECWERCSPLILQDHLTNHFLQLLESPDIDHVALKQLFNHCLVIVGQPSGTDCLAVVKYEKIGPEFLAKVRIRVLCLLDFDRIQNHLTFSDIHVKLCLKEDQSDPTGDTQKPLSWKKRIIRSTENREQTFLYFEYSGNDVLHLTKMTSGGKPLYNNQLCRLEFQMCFTLPQHDNLSVSLTTRSEIFAFCSHAKFYGKWLSKIFLEEIKNSFNNISVDAHINVLVDYINALHKRITGVEAKSHTRIFMREQLTTIYETHLMSAGFSTHLQFDIYENILDEWITQMRFMASHLFLAMMYTDNLFLGICGSDIDQDMRHPNGTTARLAMRFARVSEQEKPDNPNILFIGHLNDNSWISCISHDDVAEDLFTCICTAAQTEQNQIEVYHREAISPFTNFRRYYHSDLHGDHSVQTNNSIRSIPLNVLLRNLTETYDILLPTMNNRSSTSSTLNLSLQHTGDEHLTMDLINFMQEQYTRWCESRNVQGSLTHQQTHFSDVSDILKLFSDL